MAEQGLASPAQKFVAARKKTSKGGPLVMAVITMSIVLVLGTFVTVLVSLEEEKPEFIAKKTIYLPQRELEHKMAMAEFQQAAASPTTVEKLNAETLLSDVPALPQLPVTEFTPVENDSPIGQSQSLFGTSGLMGALSGLTTQASSVSFLGVKDDAKKILIVFDISTSVKNAMEKAGTNIDEVRTETKALIEKLNANTMFGLIQHSRGWDSFEDFLIPATVENKQAAIAWLDNEFRTDGRSGSGWTHGTPNGIQSVVKGAFRMEPDVIFLLSDMSYQRSVPGTKGENVPWEELMGDINALQAQLMQEARIHMIGFSVKEENKKEAKRLASKNKGKYREP